MSCFSLSFLVHNKRYFGRHVSVSLAPSSCNFLCNTRDPPPHPPSTSHPFLSLYICMNIYPYVYVSVNLCIYISNINIYLYIIWIYILHGRHTSMYTYLSLCLRICISVYLYIYISIYIYILYRRHTSMHICMLKKGTSSTCTQHQVVGTRVCVYVRACVCACACVRVHVRVQIPMFNADTESVTSVISGCTLSVKTLPKTNTTWNLFGC